MQQDQSAGSAKHDFAKLMERTTLTLVGLVQPQGYRAGQNS